MIIKKTIPKKNRRGERIVGMDQTKTNRADGTLSLLRTKNYWATLKSRLQAETSEEITKCDHLKMTSD